MSTVFNFVSRGVKVHNLDITWQLYWSMGDNDPEIGRKLRKANDYLTKAAIRAIEEQEPTLFWQSSEYWADFGAADSEPRGQFADLWKEAYGEDIY